MRCTKLIARKSHKVISKATCGELAFEDDVKPRALILKLRDDHRHM